MIRRIAYICFLLCMSLSWTYADTTNRSVDDKESIATGIVTGTVTNFRGTIVTVENPLIGREENEVVAALTAEVQTSLWSAGLEPVVQPTDLTKNEIILRYQSNICENDTEAGLQISSDDNIIHSATW